MNCVSLAAERFEAERTAGRRDYVQARQQAMQASLITVTNSLLAVGLRRRLFMTAQIMSDVSPLVASRYQIMICMSYAAASRPHCTYG